MGILQQQKHLGKMGFMTKSVLRGKFLASNVYIRLKKIWKSVSEVLICKRCHRAKQIKHNVKK